MESVSRNEMLKFHTRSANVRREISLCEVHRELKRMSHTKYQANLIFVEHNAPKILHKKSKEYDFW